MIKTYLGEFIFESGSGDVRVEVDAFVQGLDVAVGSLQRGQDVLHVVGVQRQLLTT